MKRLILTTSDSGAGGLLEAKLADCVIPLGPRFVWGPLPSQTELETWLSSRSARHEASGSHWLDLTGERLEEVRAEGPGLIEFCARFEAVELWVDPDPNAQLTLIWLLDYLRHHAEIASKLTLVQADVTHRQLHAGRIGRMAAAGRQNPERSSRSRQHGLAGLSPTDAAGLVRPARRGSQRPAAASAERAGIARRTSHGRDGAWRDGNADAGTDIGRQRASVRRLSRRQQAATSGACSATGKSEPCWTGSLIVRNPSCPGSTRGRSRWRCTMTASVSSDTGEAG